MSTTTHRPPLHSPPSPPAGLPPESAHGGVWAAFAVVALLSLGSLPLTTWALSVSAAAALVSVVLGLRRTGRYVRPVLDRRDLVAVVALYAAVTAAFRTAFVGFGTGRVLGLFLWFAGGMVLGVAGPVVYTVWLRRRALATLGIGRMHMRSTLAFGLVLAAVQFGMTLWNVRLPAPIDWIPLLVMSLTVGVFESVFFRGFVQQRLESSLGAGPGVAVAAGMYALYHVGYGMGMDEMTFLFGLGVVYAIAFRVVGNVLVLWPLLTPLGAFFNNLEAGDITLPWAAIAGFVDVLAVMATVLWLATRHERGRPRVTAAP